MYVGTVQCYRDRRNILYSTTQNLRSVPHNLLYLQYWDIESYQIIKISPIRKGDGLSLPNICLTQLLCGSSYGKSNISEVVGAKSL